MSGKLRKALWVGLGACVLLVAAVPALLLGRLPQMARTELQRRLPFRVEIDKAYFSWPNKVTVKGVRLFRLSDDSAVGTIHRVETRWRLRELIAGRAAVGSLVLDGVGLTLREQDESLLQGSRELPDHPVRVSGLSLKVTRGQGAEQEEAWLDVDGVGFTLEPQASECLAVEGSGNSAVMGRFRVSGVLGGRLLDSRLTVSFPDVSLDPAVIRPFPPRAAAVWDRLNPSGKATLTAELAWPSSSAAALPEVDLTWRLAIRGASMRVPGLSDPITDVSAVVEGTAEDLAITEASGNYRTGLFTGRCHSVRAEGGMGFKLIGNVRDLEPTAELIGLLPSDARAALAELHLTSGRFDGDIEVRFPPVGPDVAPVPDFVRVALGVRGASMKPDWFPYRLDKVAGGFTVGPDEMVITSPLIGWHGNAAMTLSGTIGVGEGSTSDLVLDADDLPIDTELEAALAAMGEDVVDGWRRCSLQGGTLGILLTMKGSFRKGELDWAARLSFDNASYSFPEFPYALDGATGEVHLRPERMTFKNLTAWHGDAMIRLSGWLDLGAGRDGLSLAVRGTNVELDHALAAALAPAARATWDLFQPAGLADIQVTLSTPTREGCGPDVRIGAVLKNCSALAPVGAARVALGDIAGQLECFGDVFRVTGLTAKCLEGSLAAEGVLIRADELTKIEAELSATDFSVERLAALLPGEKAERLRLLDPGGKVSIRKLILDVIERPDEKPDVQYACTLDVRDGRLSVPMWEGNRGGEDGERLALSELNGWLRVRKDRGQMTLGSFELNKVRLMNGTLRGVVGKLRKTGPVFAFEEVRGEMYGGEVEGSFRCATDLRFFSAQVSAVGMDVARLCRETELTAERVWGDLRGAVQVLGERVAGGAGAPAWRLRGSGAVHVDRANLGRTPLVESLFDYKTFLLGEEPVVEEAKARFEINEKGLVMDKLVLTGPSGSTRGVGTMGYGLDTPVDLYFYRKAKGGLLPDLPLVDLVGRGLSVVLEQIQNRIVVMHVTGTLKEPKVSPVLLRDAGERVRRSIVFSIWEEERDQGGSSPWDLGE